MGFAEKMKLLLAEKDMSQKDFAATVNMNYAHANKFFTGRTPNIEFVSKVLEVFPNVDLKWLLFAEEDVPEMDTLRESAPTYSTDKALVYIEEVEKNLNNLRSLLTQS
jgi:transcriptional regulator with XRE-family HTH domain